MCLSRMENPYYYHFVGHCGAFCGLKWRIWRAKIILARRNKPIKSCHFFSVCFLNALQSDNNSNRVYVLGHKYILGPSQSLSRAQNIFMPANINSNVLKVTLTSKNCLYLLLSQRVFSSSIA